MDYSIGDLVALRLMPGVHGPVINRALLYIAPDVPVPVYQLRPSNGGQDRMWRFAEELQPYEGP